jgi:PAS domain S-box-containing protein
LQDVETGTRGYLLTGDRNYLGPYVSGKTRAAQTLGRLDELATNDPSLERRLPALKELGQRRIGHADTVVDGRMIGMPISNLTAGMAAGNLAMDRLRNEIEDAVSVEQIAYERRKEQVEDQALLTNLALALGVVISLAAIAWLFAIRGREVARRRQAEEELKTLNSELEDRVLLRTAELERSQELLNAVVESIPDTVFLKDISNKFQYVLVNSAGEQLLGKDRQELLGHVDHELFPREQAQICLSEDEEVAASGEKRIISERSVGAGKDARFVESRKILIVGADGEQRFVLGIVRDITEKKSIETQLRQFQRIDAVGRLTGGIAHDFNNILAIIIGNVDLLREQLAGGSEEAEMADEALGAATHGAELVRRLLAFARKQHLDPVALDLNERLPAITALLRRSLGESIQIKVRPSNALWPALVDPTQVDDALVNLAINARDAMPDGGTLTIETSNIVLEDDYAEHHVEVIPGEYVMLAVSDTGAGMTPDIISNAFEPFFTTKAEGQGTGLGLSQVYGWVKQSGGHIKIYSEIGYGTTIKLYLPRAIVQGDQTEAPSSSTIDAPLGDERIFVVEDNPNVRRTVLRQLEDLGYSTIEAEDGPQALAMVRDGLQFDLLLSDVVMPGGLTGYQLAEQMKSLKPELKVLFTSGYTEVSERSADAAATGPLLSKPYRKQDLGRAVRAILDDIH